MKIIKKMKSNVNLPIMFGNQAAGVPQDSILTPIPFVIFRNEPM